jgi:hypothetical protein
MPGRRDPHAAETRGKGERRVPGLGTLLFAGIVLVQAVATLTPASLYPLNAYRMYDTHWPAGSTMVEYSVVDAAGGRHRPWHLLHIPFFQANRLVARTFGPGTRAPDAQKQRLCEQLLSADGADSLRVVAEAIRYPRDARGAIAPEVVGARTVHVCRRTPAP